MSDGKIKKDLASMYDDRSSFYGQRYQTLAGRYFMSRKIQMINTLGDFKGNEKVLEVGCANGPYTFQFSSSGYTMTGLDLSEKNILEAKKRNKLLGKNCEFICGDAHHLPFEDETFDVVISISAIRYVPNPDKAINEMYRVVKKGGKVIVDFPNKKSPWFKHLKPLIARTSHIHDNHYSVSEVRDMFSENKFLNIRNEVILFTWKSTPKFLVPLMRILDKIFESFFFSRSYASIIVCKGTK